MTLTVTWLEALEVNDRVIYHPSSRVFRPTVYDLPRVGWVIRATKAKLVIGTKLGASTGTEFDCRTGKTWGRSNDYNTAWLAPYSEEEEQKLNEARSRLEAASALCNTAREVKDKLTDYDRISRGDFRTAELVEAEAALRKALNLLTPKPTPSPAP